MKTKHYKRFLLEVVGIAEGVDLVDGLDMEGLVYHDYTSDQRLDQILDLCKDELDRLKREGF